MKICDDSQTLNCMVVDNMIDGETSEKGKRIQEQNVMRDLTIWLTYHDDSQIEQYGLREDDVFRLFKGNAVNVEGDNINHLNAFYSEIVTFYYVWKNNVRSEKVGFCHYRRRFQQLMDIEKLTVKILKEIASDFHTDFDSDIYDIQESNTDTTIDLKSKIKNGLNELFRRNHRLKYGNSFYGEDDFRASANNREIPFLYYKPKKEVYVIQSKSFVDTISNLVNETLNLDEIVSYLEIDVSEESQQKVYGQNIGYGFELSESDLQLKVFGIRIYESSEINSNEDDDVDESKDDTDKSESKAIDQD